MGRPAWHRRQAGAGAGSAIEHRGEKHPSGQAGLAAGERPQLRKRSKASWTKTKEREFLAVLAETCNVTQAAKAAGVSLGGAYRRRKSHAAFRAGWGEALSTAYRRLELVLLDRAFNGSDKVVTRKDGSEERVREYPNSIALALLRMHRDTVVEAETEFAPQELDELRQKLIGKLDRLKAREDARDGEDGDE